MDFMFVNNSLKMPGSLPPGVWNKYGEIYWNNEYRCRFVCTICLSKVYHLDHAYHTNEAPAFWAHIQYEHIQKQQNYKREHTQQLQAFESNCEINSNVCKSAEEPFSKKVKYEPNSCENVNSNTNETVPSLRESCDEETANLTEDNFPANNKDEEFQKVRETLSSATKSSCSVINENSFNSTSDKGYAGDKKPSFKAINEENCGYLRHNDFIEISDDDEDDEDDENCNDPVNTRPNSRLMLSNDEQIATISPINGNKESGLFYNCMECNLFFTTKHAIEEHMISHTANAQDSSNLTGNVPVNPVNCIPTPESSPNSVMSHSEIQQTSNYSQTVINPEFLDFQKEKHILSQKAETAFKTLTAFQCHICGQRTKTEKSMEKHHLHFHSPESNSYVTKCEICNKPILKKNLKLHIVVHSNTRFKCNFCDLTYKRKQTVRKHMKLCHGNEPPPANGTWSVQLINCSDSSVTNENHNKEPDELLPQLTPEEQYQMQLLFLQCQS